MNHTKILLVDDQPISLLYLKKTLSRLENMEITTCGNAQEALNLFPLKPWDLIVADYQMPGMNGLDFIRQFRLIKGGEETPILMVTASTDPNVKYQLLDLGIVDFLQKPADASEIIARARNLISLHKATVSLKNHNQELKKGVQEMTKVLAEREQESLIVLARAAESRDPQTGSHLLRMASYSKIIALALGLSEEEAEEIYLHATALNNGSADAWNSLGNLWQDQFKLYDKAAEAYRHAIKLAPKSAASYCNLGRLFFNHLKNNSEAEKAFKNAIDVDETHAESWNGYANTLSCNRTRLAEAESAFLKAIALDPLQSVYVANLAQLKVGNNKVDEANFLYRQVLNIATKDDDHIKLQANLWLGNFDFALNALDTLSSKAHGGSNLEFFAIREQCWECSRLGLASKLSELIARSAWADFLLPFRLALDAFASGNKPTGAAPEFFCIEMESISMRKDDGT